MLQQYGKVIWMIEWKLCDLGGMQSVIRVDSGVNGQIRRRLNSQGPFVGSIPVIKA